MGAEEISERLDKAGSDGATHRLAITRPEF